MKLQLSKKKKILIAILSFIFILFFFLSSLVKYWVVKNSEELVGRKLEISELHFNYAQVSLGIKGFNLFEADKASSFVAFNELHVNFSPWYLIKSEYAFSEIYLDGLNVSVIQDSLGFNFDSMIPAQDSIEEEPSEEKDLKFSIKNIQFKNGSVRYIDEVKNSSIAFDKMDLALPLIAWNNQNSEMGVDFAMGDKGRVQVSADIDHAKNAYTIDLATQSIDLEPIKAYLTDYIDISAIAGQLNTTIHMKGSLDNPMDLVVSGQTNVVDFEMKDGDEKKLFAAKNVDVVLDSLNVGTSHYEIGSIELDSPEIYASLDKESSNFERMLAPYMRADSLEQAALNPAADSLTTDTVSNLFYQLKSISVSNGLVNFTDNTLNRPFVYDLSNIAIQMGTLSEQSDSVPLSYSMNLHGTGRSAGEGTFSMKDFSSINFKNKLENLDMMSFSPYTEFYIARPITQGELNYETSLAMTATQLKNDNHIHISELDFGKKTKDKNTFKVPVRLALYLLKDKDDQIDFELPVSGNPEDPDFKVGKIVWKTVTKFLIKTASQPFNILGNLAGGDPESIKSIPFHFSQDSLDANQKVNLRKIATILSKKDELSFAFVQETNLKKEKELLALKSLVDTYCVSKSISSPDVSGDQLISWATSNIDFMTYLNPNSTEGASLASLCTDKVGKLELDSMFMNLLQTRNRVLNTFLNIVGLSNSTRKFFNSIKDNSKMKW